MPTISSAGMQLVKALILKLGVAKPEQVVQYLRTHCSKIPEDTIAQVKSYWESYVDKPVETDYSKQRNFRGIKNAPRRIYKPSR